MNLVTLPNGDLLIPLDGMRFDHVRLSRPGDFYLTCSQAEVAVSAEVLELTVEGKTVTIDVEDRSSWGLIMTLLDSKISRCFISNALGVLFIRFQSGYEARLLRLVSRENWEVSIGTNPLHYSIVGLMQGASAGYAVFDLRRSE